MFTQGRATTRENDRTEEKPLVGASVSILPCCCGNWYSFATAQLSAPVPPLISRQEDRLVGKRVDWWAEGLIGRQDEVSGVLHATAVATIAQ